VILLLTGVLVWQLISRPDPPRPPLPAAFFVTVGLFLVFAAVAAWIDLFIAFAVFAVGLSMAWGERRLVPILAIAVVLPLAIFLLFDLVLEIRFPRGVLTSLYYD
ncbi:MAG: tripartite tricarboxylate transporter TctB family protein, partial [Methyloligellaceae bacterium]